jgi:hypothetical protein
MAKPFKNAKDLLAKLAADDPSGPVFTGMIKSSDDNAEILFAKTGDCSQWIPLPVSQIEDVEHLRWVHCGEDKYRQVHVIMKAPQTKEAGVFADLATFHQHQANNFGPPGTSQCHFDIGLNKIVCP